MEMNLIYLIIGLAAGGLLAFIVLRKSGQSSKMLQDNYIRELKDELKAMNNEYEELREIKEKLVSDVASLHTSLSTLKAENQSLLDKLQQAEQNIEHKIEVIQQLNEKNASYGASIKSLEEQKKDLLTNKDTLEKSLKERNEQLTEASVKMADMEAGNKSLQEKLDTQKNEMEELGKKFSNEFKVLANQILEEKSKKFTEVNQSNLEKLLDPLGKNINDFKKKVEETYDKESKQRFSLEEKIKDLVELNNRISEEANNLTKALKGQAKKQGQWGEMILENLLEQSGLQKNREYFIQEFLKDESGNTIKNEEGKKLQPDVIIAYPDNRKVIIDSKVSLTAYERYTSADDAELQQQALQDHLKSVRNHVEELSRKNYHNYAPSLDFTMLFIPIEPAYLLAIQNDPDLWNYAYHKRILLISPTNLIAALKLIVDLWKREYQNRNALEIAERGGKLYDKFVILLNNLKDLGKHMDRTHVSYQKAMENLSEGRGNLVGQVEKLKKLGVNAKKTIHSEIKEQSALDQEESE